jgi:hypothetical protein
LSSIALSTLGVAIEGATSFSSQENGISTAEKLCVIFGQVLFFAMIRLWPQNKNV